jgi:CheY-like chemotaxis protein
MPVSILLIDDSPSTREVLRVVLELERASAEPAVPRAAASSKAWSLA